MRVGDETPEDLGLMEVKVVQTDDGHNYIIPAESYDNFSIWMELDPWYQDEEAQEYRQKFEDFFEQYRTGGDIYQVRLYAKVGYEKETDF